VGCPTTVLGLLGGAVLIPPPAVPLPGVVELPALGDWTLLPPPVPEPPLEPW
jgi:hypothetical protein